MRYVCIKCYKIWGKREPGETDDDISGSFCDTCFTGLIRKKQVAKGYHDCYRRATEVCSRTECSYHELCCANL